MTCSNVFAALKQFGLCTLVIHLFDGSKGCLLCPYVRDTVKHTYAHGDVDIHMIFCGHLKQNMSQIINI